MAIRINLTLLICFISFSLFGQGIANQYILYSLDDGLHYTVSIKEDFEKDITFLSTKNDTIKISGARGVKNAITHLGKFLEIQYMVRGGSNAIAMEKVLVCISKSRIYKVLNVLSDFTSIVNEVYDKPSDSLKLFEEEEDYHIKISINQKGLLYKAVLVESERIKSKYDPSQNTSVEKTYILDFDITECYFFNSIKHLNKLYKIYSIKDDKTFEKFINEEVPCIEFDQFYYIRLGNDWCVNNGRDILSCR